MSNPARTSAQGEGGDEVARLSDEAATHGRDAHEAQHGFGAHRAWNDDGDPGDEAFEIVGGSISVVEDTADSSPEDALAAQLVQQEAEAPAIAEAVGHQDAPDAADTLESLPQEAAASVLEEMEARAAADVLAEMEVPLAVSVVEDLIDEGNIAYAARLINLMADDDATDLLQGMDKKHQEALLAGIPSRQAAVLRRLIGYDRESAGGMMTTEFIAVGEDKTIAGAIAQVRGRAIPETMQKLFVVDDEGRLKGVLALRDLVVSSPEKAVTEVMRTEVTAVDASTDREVVAREFDRYGFSMLPVVDRTGYLLGVVTVDDVIDIIREEETEDVQKTVGAGGGEAVYSGLGVKLRGRLPWLMVNLCTSIMAAMVVSQFQGLIAELAILAVLMPVIANQAGNAGQQSLAVTLRGIVLDEVRSGRVAPLILRESLVGAINGTIAGLIIGGGVWAFSSMISGASWHLGAVAAISMSIALSLGCLSGSTIPLLMRRMGADPAHGSTIFLTMITDTMSFFVFLTCAQLLQEWIVPAAH